MARILIVEDEAVHADLLRHNLCARGHKDVAVLISPMTKKKVVEFAIEFQPELVVIDDLLDGWKMRGLKLFGYLRTKLPDNVEYSLVSITASIPYTRTQYINAGMKASNIIPKPFRDVTVAINRLCAIIPGACADPGEARTTAVTQKTKGRLEQKKI